MPQGGMGSVAAAAVHAVRATEGLTASQAMIDRIARLPSPGGDFWRAAVQLEATAAASCAAETQDAAAPAVGEIKPATQVPLNDCTVALACDT